MFPGNLTHDFCAANALPLSHMHTLIEHYANLPNASYRLTNMIYSLKVQHVFTYGLITGNISNSLKNVKQ